MKIILTSVFVDDQDKALKYYTETLGFVKKNDVPAGQYRWLTVVSPEDQDCTELLLEPSDNLVAKEYKKGLVEQTAEVQRRPDLRVVNRTEGIHQHDVHTKSEIPVWVDSIVYVILSAVNVRKLHVLDHNIYSAFQQAVSGLSSEIRKTIVLPQTRETRDKYILYPVLERIRQLWNDNTGLATEQGKTGNMVRTCNNIKSRNLNIDGLEKLICNHYNVVLPEKSAKK